MSTGSHTSQGKKVDKYVVLVLSLSIILSVAIWIWYDAKLDRIEQEMSTDNSENNIDK